MNHKVAAALGFLLAGGGLLLISRRAMATTFPTLKKYPPNSAAAKALLTAAARAAGLPESWGTDPDAHWIMGVESKGGTVGIPNYLFGKAITSNPDTWPGVWERLRRGEKFGIGSHATGLGQLQPDNVKLFYPSGLQGIGDAFEEAVGFLRYIRSRYGSPQVARGIYGKLGTYVHAVTGETRKKTFKEGY